MAQNVKYGLFFIGFGIVILFLGLIQKKQEDPFSESRRIGAIVVGPIFIIFGIFAIFRE